MHGTRAKQRGAIVVVVAMSLSLLAVVGLYAFSNAQRSVRGAGSVRVAAQGRGVAEHAVQTTAELVNPYSSAWIDAAMKAYAFQNHTSGGASDCLSIPPSAAVSTGTLPPLSKRCYKQTSTGVGDYFKNSLSGGGALDPLSGAFSGGTDTTNDLSASYTIELTDPTDFHVGLAGSSISRRQCVKRYTTTIRALMSTPGSGSKPTTRTGARGRVMTGPQDCGS